MIALAGYLGDIRSFSATDLEIYANIQQSGDGESRTLMVPNHDAFDAFIDLSLNDEQIEQLWTLVCDPNSKLAERLGGVPGQELQEQWVKWTDQQQAWHSSVLSSAQVAICKFASRVWRRPLEKQERETICDTLAAGIKQGQSLQDASLLPLFRIFMSPHFLYRIEIGEVASVDDTSPLAETKELVSYLSLNWRIDCLISFGRLHRMCCYEMQRNEGNCRKPTFLSSMRDE